MMRGRFGFGWVAFIAFMVVQALGTFFEERSDRPPIRRPTLPPIHDEGPEESRGAAALPRYLEGMLFGLTLLDPATFVAVALLFIVVAVGAAVAPARRAMRVDPIIALRAE